MDSQDEETEYCTNCKHDIPSNNYVMHQTHCFRNIILCKKCDEPVPRSEMDAHDEEYHVLELCECGESIEREHFSDHKENRCKLRIVKCEYCELDLPFEKLKEHCDFCGSRTEKCPKCNKYVKLRDQVIHDLNECQIDVGESLFGSQQSHSSPYYRSSFSPTKKTATGYTSGISGGTTFPYQQLYSPTVMEELDSDRMVGVRRSSKNERIQRQHKKNERTVQNRHSSGHDEPDSISSTRQQEEDDYLFALRLASNVSDGPSQLPQEVEADIAPFVPPILPTFVSSRHSYLSQDPQVLTGFREEDRRSDTVQIPCEFCSQLIAPSELLDHQEQCLLWYGEPPGHIDNVVEVNDEMPPLRPIPHQGVSFHSPSPEPAILDPDLNFNNVRDSPSLRMSPTRPYSMENSLQQRSGLNADRDRMNNQPVGEDDIMVPCEFCEAQLPFDTISFHQAVCESGPQQSFISDDMREYQFGSPVPEIEYPQVVRARRQESPVDLFEDITSDNSFTNTPKHQPDPDLNWIWKTEGSKVNVVSHEKTVNMLQKSASQTSNGHVRRRETTLPSKSPFLQSHSSAFVPPKVNVVSKEKTYKMQQQQKLKKKNIPENSSATVQSSFASSSQGRGRNVPSGSRTLNANHENSGSSPTSFQLSSEVIRSTRGMASRGTRHNSNLARDSFLLDDFEEDKIQNVTTVNSQPSSSHSPPQVQRERTWEEILTEMKLEKYNKQVNNSTARQPSAAKQGGKIPQTFRADSQQKFRNTPSSEGSFLNNSRVSSESSPLNKKRSVTSKQLAQRNDVSVLGKSSKEQGSPSSTVYTAHKTSQKCMSSASLSSRVTPPQSTRGKKSAFQQVQGASHATLHKKDNSGLLQADQSRKPSKPVHATLHKKDNSGLLQADQSRKPSKPVQPHMDIDDDFLSKIIADTNRMVTSGNQANSERTERSGTHVSSQGGGQQQRAPERQGRKPRSANIVANFSEDNDRPKRDGRPPRRGGHSRGAGQRGCRNYGGYAD